MVARITSFALTFVFSYGAYSAENVVKEKSPCPLAIGGEPVLLEPVFSSKKFEEMTSEKVSNLPDWSKDNQEQISRDQALENILNYILRFGLPDDIEVQDWSPVDVKNLLRLFVETETAFGKRYALAKMSYKTDLKNALDRLLSMKGEIIILDPWGHYAGGYAVSISVSAAGRVHESVDHFHFD